MQNIVVVGASLSGVRTAEALRAKGFTGKLTIVGDESALPYDRPPLSKSFLEGKRAAEQMSLSPNDPAFSKLDATFVLGTPARALTISTQTIELADGTTLGFDGLVIATGTRLRTLPSSVTGAHPAVFGLRTLNDAETLKAHLTTGARVVVIGAGFIGAEVASTAHTLGCVVTVVEAADVPLARQLGDEMGSALGDLHAANGVTLLLGAQVASLTSNAVVLADGSEIAADVVVVGIGVQPNVEWLVGSGLDTDNGVLCDESLRAVEHANIVAVGDIARWTNPRFAHEGAVRIEHWTNAAESADHAAATLLGDVQPFAPVPYFWSDQYGRKIQFLGRAAGFDEVRVVTGKADDKFVALYRRGDELVAALGVSSVKAVMGFRQRLVERCSWDEAMESLQPESVRPVSPS
jgi:NADPH-dependent 2,4-dienoyl-CoA reductase/sulfur reductase-like enzyme